MVTELGFSISIPFIALSGGCTSQQSKKGKLDAKVLSGRSKGPG
jgi:hypothetical protein